LRVKTGIDRVSALKTCPECVDGESDDSNPCSPKTCVDGSWLEAIVDCAEAMGVPCAAGYIPAEEGECCSTCPEECYVATGDSIIISGTYHPNDEIYNGYQTYCLEDGSMVMRYYGGYNGWDFCRAESCVVTQTCEGSVGRMGWISNNNGVPNVGAVYTWGSYEATLTLGSCSSEEELEDWCDPEMDTIADGPLIANGDVGHFENLDSIEACMALCDTYSDCNGAVYNTKNKRCWIKSGSTTLRVKTGIDRVSALKTCPESREESDDESEELETTSLLPIEDITTCSTEWRCVPRDDRVIVARLNHGEVECMERPNPSKDGQCYWNAQCDESARPLTPTENSWTMDQLCEINGNCPARCNGGWCLDVKETFMNDPNFSYCDTTVSLTNCVTEWRCVPKGDNVIVARLNHGDVECMEKPNAIKDGQCYWKAECDDNMRPRTYTDNYWTMDQLCEINGNCPARCNGGWCKLVKDTFMNDPDYGVCS